ncbi:MAG: hypothetical protein WD381_04660 [Balneolaceae bacterium]
MKKRARYTIQPLMAFLFIILCQPLAMAQTETEQDNEGTLRVQHFDARTLSLGEATLADVFGNTTIGINPALSGLLNNGRELHLNSYHNWDTNLVQHDVTLPSLILNKHHFTARAGLTNSGYEEINYLGSAQLPEPDVEQYHADLAYAYAFSNVFSMGVLQSVSYTFNDEDDFVTYFADIGLVYAPAENLSYGLAVRGIGRDSHYTINTAGETILYHQRMGQILDLGSTFRFSQNKRTFLTMSLGNEKRFGEDGIWYKGGIELIPIPAISIRGGALFHVGQDEFIPRLGIGLDAGYFILDYMAAPKNIRGENYHQLGLTFQF